MLQIHFFSNCVFYNLPEVRPALPVVRLEVFKKRWIIQSRLAANTLQLPSFL